MAMADTMGPLDGLKVLEFSDHEGVQYCGRTLAALGADVVKLEPRGGDPLRHRPPLVAGAQGPLAVAFEYLNAGKRSVETDVTSGEIDQRVTELIEDADVVLVSPEHGDLLGLDGLPRPPGQVRAVAGGFGAHPAESGPTTAFTRLHAASTGYLVPGDKDESVRPGWGGPYVFESMFGIGLAVAVTAELRGGSGGEIDFTYQGYGVWMDKMFFPRIALSDTFDLHRYSVAYPFGGSVECRDGFACIFVIEEHQWESLARTIGHDDWLDDPRMADGVKRIEVQEAIDEELAAWCATRTVDEVIAAGREADFPVGRVRAPSEVLASSQLKSRGFVAQGDTRFGSVPVVGLPFGEGLPSVPLGPAPELGQHTDDARDSWRTSTNRRSSDRRPESGRARPLEGLRVLDFTWAAAGPIVTSFMAYLGADVVKVEHRSRPDLMRAAQKQYGYSDDEDLDSSPSFQEIAAGKRSIELNLRDADDRATAFDLASVADVLVENMRPGKIEALGLSFEAVSAVNPGIVMCSQSATARVEGPGIPGYAPIFWAEGGGSFQTGWPHRPPGVVRGPVDFHAAAFACLGTLALLDRRSRTGTGGYVDCSAIETVAAAFGPEMLLAAVTGQDNKRRGNDLPGALLNDVFPCHGEDDWIAVTVRDAAEWIGLADALGRPDLADLDPEDLDYETIATITAVCDASRLEGRLLALGVPAARSLSLRAAFDDARLANRGIWQKVQHPVIGEQTLVGVPWVFDGREYVMHRGGANLGEHSDQIRKEWLDR